MSKKKDIEDDLTVQKVGAGIGGVQIFRGKRPNRKNNPLLQLAALKQQPPF